MRSVAACRSPCFVPSSARTRTRLRAPANALTYTRVGSSGELRFRRMGGRRSSGREMQGEQGLIRRNGEGRVVVEPAFTFSVTSCKVRLQPCPVVWKKVSNAPSSHIADVQGQPAPTAMECETLSSRQPCRADILCFDLAKFPSERALPRPRSYCRTEKLMPSALDSQSCFHFKSYSNAASRIRVAYIGPCHAHHITGTITFIMPFIVGAHQPGFIGLPAGTSERGPSRDQRERTI